MKRHRGTTAFQGPAGIRGVASGGVLTVHVGPNDREIEVVNTATGERSTHPVSPGKTTSIPMPSAPPGTALTVQVGRGRNAQLITVEVIGPGP